MQRHLATLLIAAIQYVRWSQLIPMLTAWVLLLLMLMLIVAISFQEGLDDLLVRSEPWLESLLGAAPQVGEPAVAEAQDGAGRVDASGALELDDIDIRPWIVRGWLVLALIGALFDGVFRGRFSIWPARLRGRLVLAAVPAVGVALGLSACYLFGSEQFHGSLFSWLLLFAGAPLVVWLVSAYSLTVSAVLGALIDRIDSDQIGADPHLEALPERSDSGL
jgi:hypothetical protein